MDDQAIVDLIEKVEDSGSGVDTKRATGDKWTMWKGEELEWKMWKETLKDGEGGGHRKWIRYNKQ